MIARHLLLLLLTLPVALNAQVLPPEIRIEAAAAIGSRSLVVWGSTRLVADTIAPVLYWQMIDGAAPIGDPLPLADSTFAPTTYLQIIPFDRHFLILWNDRKYDSLTTWSTRIDTGGTTETPALFADTAVRPQGVFRFDKPDGYTLLWNRWTDSTTARIIGHDVSPDGERRGGTIEIGEGWMSGIDTNVGAEGLRLIDRGMMAPLTIDKEGTFGVLSAKTRGLLNGRSWCRDKSGSLWIVNNNGPINRYRSVIDTIVADTLRSPFREGWNVSLHPIKDSNSTLTLRFAIADIYPYQVNTGYFYGAIYEISKDDLLRTKKSKQLSKAIIEWIASHRPQYGFKGYSGTLTRFGGNCYLSRLQYSADVRVYFNGELDTAYVDTGVIYSLSTTRSTPWFEGRTNLPLPSVQNILDVYCPAPRESANPIVQKTSLTNRADDGNGIDNVELTDRRPWSVFDLSPTGTAPSERPDGSSSSRSLLELD